MKNLINILPIFLVILTSCNSFDDGIAKRESQQVIIRAYNDSTRVSFNGSSSCWESGDILNVAIDGLDDVYQFNYTSENEFICNSLALPSTSNNLYAFCGVNPNNINVSNKTALVKLGTTIQTQNTQNPTAHISEYDILYGAALGVSDDDITISMNHTISILKINISNSLQEVQNIKSVTVTTPENIMITGDYNISPDGNNKLSIVPGSGSNSVTVKFDEIELRGGNSSSFTAWLAVAPFKLDQGDNLTIDITTSDNTIYRCKKIISNQAGKSFNAGSIMSTSIVLGDNATTETSLPATIDYTLDMASLATAGFPTSQNSIEKEGEYTVDGYTFKFNSPTNYYLYSSKIYFKGNGKIKNDSPVMIELPQKSGYKLNSVTLASNDATRDRNYTYTIAYYKDGILKDVGKDYMSAAPKEFDLSGIDMPANTAYYIWIGNMNGGNQGVAVLTNLSLHYTQQ